jgi:hypothetical protein
MTVLWTTEELVRIARAGGGLEVDASRRTGDDLTRIALAAASKGARLRISNSRSKTTDELVRIVLAAKGKVTLLD